MVGESSSLGLGGPSLRVSARPGRFPMNTTTSSAALVRAGPVFTNTQRLALAGFLTGYSGLTREAYELDLRQYASWCRQHHLRLFEGRRADIECFARDLEGHGRRLRTPHPRDQKAHAGSATGALGDLHRLAVLRRTLAAPRCRPAQAQRNHHGK